MGERPEQVWAEEVKSDKSPAIREGDKDAVIPITEQNQVYRKFVESMSTVSEFEAEWMTQEYLRQCREIFGWTQEQADMMECGIRWAVEARRNRKRRRARAATARRTFGGDDENRQRKCDSRPRGGVDGHDKLDETCGKGKGEGNGGKGEHGGKGDKGGKGFQQSAKMMKGEE